MSIRYFSRSLSALFFAACLAAAPLLCGQTLRAQAASSGSDEKTHNRPALTPSQAARLMDPSGLRLSPEAEHLYYYLVLSQGLVDNSDSTVAQALKGLLKRDPSLPVFQDGATILLARHEFAAAEAMAKDGLKRFPGDGLLTLLLSGAYSESGRVPEAIRLLEGFLKKNPEHVECAQELVKLYLKEGMEQKAADLTAKLPQNDMQPESELFRAGVLSSVGRIQEARELLQRLLEKNPDFYQAWMELAYTAESESKVEEALEAYKKAASLMPENPEPQYRIAMLLLGADKAPEALEALREANLEASQYMQAAVRFADSGSYPQAEELLTVALQKGAPAEECALLLSMFRQESSGDPEEAVAPLAAIGKESPLYPAALEQKARVYLSAGLLDKAHALANEARTAYPGRKALWGMEAYIQVKRGKKAEAEALLESALKQYPEDEELLFSLGGVQHEAGKEDAAMKTMERIININPRNYQALNYVGYSLADQGRDLKRALTLVNAALEQSPDADYIMDSLAWVQYKLGRHEEAWQSINRCLNMGGNDAAIWEHYGDIALALGKKDEAAKGYEEALARKPENASELRGKLKALDGK